MLLVTESQKSFGLSCEGPCSDLYWSIGTTSPATGSTYTQGDQVVYTTTLTKKLTGASCTVVPSINPTSGWGVSRNSPSSPYSFPGLGATTDVVVTVDVGLGTATVTVTLDCTYAYDDSSFTFTVTGEAAGNSVRVYGLSDMSGTWNGSGDATNNDDVCLYSSDGSYDILVEGPTDSGNYVLESGANKIPITVYWNDDTGTTGRTTLNSADDPSVSGATGADTSSQTCSGGNTANISWKALESDLQTKPAGTYSATMTITATAP